MFTLGLLMFYVMYVRIMRIESSVIRNNFFCYRWPVIVRMNKSNIGGAFRKKQFLETSPGVQGREKIKTKMRTKTMFRNREYAGDIAIRTIIMVAWRRRRGHTVH